MTDALEIKYAQVLTRLSPRLRTAFAVACGMRVLDLYSDGLGNRASGLPAKGLELAWEFVKTGTQPAALDAIEAQLETLRDDMEEELTPEYLAVIDTVRGAVVCAMDSDRWAPARAAGYSESDAAAEALAWKELDGASARAEEEAWQSALLDRLDQVTAATVDEGFVGNLTRPQRDAERPSWFALWQAN